MGVVVAIKVFVLCQTEKVLILSTKSEIPWLHCFSSRYSNRRRVNESHT